MHCSVAVSVCFRISAKLLPTLALPHGSRAAAGAADVGRRAVVNRVFRSVSSQESSNIYVPVSFFEKGQSVTDEPSKQKTLVH